MNVLHVLGTPDFGGIQRLVLSLALALRESGRVESGIMFTKMDGSFLHKFERSGLPLFSGESAGDGGGWSTGYKRTCETFKRFDILHFHAFHPLLAACAVRAGRPVVYTDHGTFFGYGRRWTTRDTIKVFLLRIFLNRYVDYITFNSKFTRDIALQRYGLTGKRMTVVRNGVDFKGIERELRRDSAAIRSMVKNRFVVGTSARFAGVKRIDRLIDGFVQFKKNKPDVVLLLVGDGPEKTELERRVKQYGISDDVIFTGYQSEVYAYQSVMDVCVIPSQGETFGLVAVECLYQGKPAIVFNDGGGIVEIIEEITPPDVVKDMDGLVDRLNCYYRSRDLLTAEYMRRKNHAERFDIMEVVNDFIKIYDQSLSLKP